MYPSWVFWILLSVFSKTSISSGMQEYCESESFTAECAENEVILMEQARYGRMRIGRCIRLDYGFVGCYADVLQITDSMCSGRHTCSIQIPSSAFESTRPCPRDVKSYFEASYRCVRVETNGGRPCQDGFAKAEMPSGYISKMPLEVSGYGGPDCPWLIEVQPGQRINITLYEFHTGSWRETSPVGGTRVIRVCKVLAIIREHGDGVKRGSAVTVCSGVDRLRQVYTSSSNSVEIRFLGLSQDFFLIQYRAFGCPEVAAPEHGWTQRSGNVLTLGCNTSLQVWHLQCRDDTWIGSSQSCPEGTQTTAPTIDKENQCQRLYQECLQS